MVFKHRQKLFAKSTHDRLPKLVENWRSAVKANLARSGIAENISEGDQLFDDMII